MKTTIPVPKPAPPLGQRQFVKITDLRPDPDQPRKIFEQAALQSLAESIKQQGIIHDLIVEHRPGVRIDAPDLVSKEWRAVEEGTKRVLITGNERMVKDYAHGKEEAWYQIVDGERRWKAAMLAGIKEVPVAVRTIDAKMRLALQVVANQQHEALNALEEAAAYRKEIDSGRHTAESLFKSLGISRGTLFARLALNRLHPPVRAALEQGKISVSVAGLVTMVPGLKAQEELIKELTNEESWGYPWSFRNVQERIEQEYCRQLKGAPFDPKKSYAGEFKEGKDDGAADELGGTVNLFMRGACTECRYRSGNLGVECGNPNVCTRPKCFEAKTKAAWLERSLKAQADGQKTIDAGQWAKSKGQYVKLDHEEHIGNAWRNWKDAMGGQGKKVERILAQTPEGVIEVVRREDAKEAAKKNGVKFQSPGGGYDYEAEQKKQKERDAITSRAVARAKPLVEGFLEKLTGLPALRLIALRMQEEFRHYGKNSELKPEAIAKLNQAKLEVALLRFAYLEDDGIDYQGKLDDRFVRICEACKVDVETMLKEEQEAEKTKTAKGGGKPKSKRR
jgi:ParB family transcriptional regulator, chromosome partitioning protein